MPTADAPVPPLVDKKPLCFLSHAHANKDFAHRLAKDLRKHGVNLWLDRIEIQAGENWDSKIEEGLATADALIFIMSPESAASKNVMDEVYSFYDEKRRIIPVLYRPCARPLWLRRVHYIDFFAKGYGEALSELLDTCDDPNQAPQLLPGSATHTTSMYGLLCERVPYVLPTLLMAAVIVALVSIPREWVWLPAAWRAVISPAAALAGMLLYRQVRERSMQRTSAKLAGIQQGASRAEVLRIARMKAQRAAISFLLATAVFALTLVALARDCIRPVGEEIDLTGTEVQYPSLVDESARLIFRPLYYESAAVQHVVDSVEDFESVDELAPDWDIQMIDGVANSAAIDPYLDGMWIYSQDSILRSKLIFAALLLGAALSLAAGLSYGATARRDLHLDPVE